MIDYDKFELLTTVDLAYEAKDPSKTALQFIYASELYGTLFGIFAEFEIDPKSTLDKCIVTGIKLRILNYKGVINIGFVADSLSYDPSDLSKKYLTFQVQGANFNLEERCDIQPPIVFDKGDRDMITFGRILVALPNAEYPKPTIAVPSSDTTTALGAQPPQSKLFDSEFHYRDGVEYVNSAERIGIGNAPPHPKSRDKELPGARCYQGMVNLVF